MKIEKLTLRNFRNLKEASFTPDATVNFLMGLNGQGKTSILEALGLLSSLQSFRESKSSNLIRWGESDSEVSCTLTSGASSVSSSDDWKTDLRITLHAHDTERLKVSKLAFINQKPFRSSTQFLSQRFGAFELGFHSIIFNPSDHDLVRGDPKSRRAYLNRVISAESMEYLKTLQKYNRTLEQRNSLLKAGEGVDRRVLLGFTEQLCEYGVYLTYARLNWIHRASQCLPMHSYRIAPQQLPLKLVYLSNWANRGSERENLALNSRELDSIHFSGQGALPSLELLEQSFWAKLSVLEIAERRLGQSLVGPHRDDWAFFLGEQMLKGHGSQGEVRSALLALKLSEIELFRKETGHRPLFLLDDFSSELDQGRRLLLLQFLVETDLQTFVTTTEDLSYVGKRYWVRNGVIEEGRHDIRTTTG